MLTLITSLTIRMNAKYLSFPEQENYKTTGSPSTIVRNLEKGNYKIAFFDVAYISFVLKLIFYVSRAALQLQMPEKALQTILPRTKSRLPPGKRSKGVFLPILNHTSRLSGLKSRQ